MDKKQHATTQTFTLDGNAKKRLVIHINHLKMLAIIKTHEIYVIVCTYDHSATNRFTLDHHQLFILHK